MDNTLATSHTPTRRQRRPNRSWMVTVLVVTLLLAIPVVVVLAHLFVPTGDVWQHLQQTVLPRYVRNSLWLMVGVASGALLLGVSTAWLVTMCRFPGRWVFEWALLLPMAMPAYLLAYTYTDVLEFAGPVQTTLREIFGWGPREYWFPNVRSRGGATLLLALVLYPYVYMLTRATFLEQSVSLLEASRSLGRSAWRSFFTVALPLARPAIVAGVALVCMETLSDFGTVDYFGVQTFTTGIYRTWYGLGERAAAAQLSAVLLLFVLVLLLLERRSRKQGQTSSRGHERYRTLPRYHLQGWRAVVAWLVCALPIALGFAVPAGLLANMALRNASQALDADVWGYASNSLLLATITAAVALIVSLLLAYGLRLYPNRVTKLATRVAALGYAVPGSVIAVGVLMAFGWFDNSLDAWLRSTVGISSGLLLSGTLVGLVFAYVVRFLAVALGMVEASLSAITPSMDDAAQSLGHRSLSRLWRVHVPLMRGSLLTAILLVFVDVIKELPITVIVRPFNFETLATRVYRLASDERLVESSGLALMIVLVGIVPVVILSRAIASSRHKSGQ